MLHLFVLVGVPVRVEPAHQRIACPRGQAQNVVPSFHDAIIAGARAMVLFLYLMLSAVSARDACDEVETQLAELKALVAKLEDELLACKEGHSVGLV